MRFVRLALLATVIVVASVASVVGACNAVVLNSTAPFRFDTIRHVPRREVALVLGAGLNPDGTPSAMLADRVDGGIALLRARRVRMLLFSGDNGTVEHNELASMQRYALGRGVPARSIVLDYAGFNTYDSCYRARRIFGVRSAVVVTQEFHLARSVFFCRNDGIDAVGYSRPDWGIYDAGMMGPQAVRETLARVGAVIHAWTRPVPPIMGSPEPLPRHT